MPDFGRAIAGEAPPRPIETGSKPLRRAVLGLLPQVQAVQAFGCCRLRREVSKLGVVHSHPHIPGLSAWPVLNECLGGSHRPTGSDHFQIDEAKIEEEARYD